MRVVRLVLWLVLGFAFLAFAAANWQPVPMIFGAKEVIVVLPLLLLVVGLAGYVFAALRYRLGRRSDVLAAPAYEPIAGPTPDRVVQTPHPGPLPSEAQPTIVPPGCG